MIYFNKTETFNTYLAHIMAANQGLGLSCIKNPTCLTINNKQCTESCSGIKLYFSPEICVKLLFETQAVYIKNVFFYNKKSMYD